MLDAYIIERIKKERDRDAGYAPLRIEPPPQQRREPEEDRDRNDRGRTDERGSAVIDFRL